MTDNTILNRCIDLINTAKLSPDVLIREKLILETCELLKHHSNYYILPDILPAIIDFQTDFSPKIRKLIINEIEDICKVYPKAITPSLLCISILLRDTNVTVCKRAILCCIALWRRSLPIILQGLKLLSLNNNNQDNNELIEDSKTIWQAFHDIRGIVLAIINNNDFDNQIDILNVLIKLMECFILSSSPSLMIPSSSSNNLISLLDYNIENINNSFINLSNFINQGKEFYNILINILEKCIDGNIKFNDLNNNNDNNNNNNNNNKRKRRKKNKSNISDRVKTMILLINTLTNIASIRRDYFYETSDKFLNLLEILTNINENENDNKLALNTKDQPPLFQSLKSSCLKLLNAPFHIVEVDMMEKIFSALTDFGIKSTKSAAENGIDDSRKMSKYKKTLININDFNINEFNLNDKKRIRDDEINNNNNNNNKKLKQFFIKKDINDLKVRFRPQEENKLLELSRNTFYNIFENPNSIIKNNLNNNNNNDNNNKKKDNKNKKKKREKKKDINNILYKLPRSLYQLHSNITTRLSLLLSLSDNDLLKNKIKLIDLSLIYKNLFNNLNNEIINENNYGLSDNHPFIFLNLPDHLNINITIPYNLIKIIDGSFNNQETALLHLNSLLYEIYSIDNKDNLYHKIINFICLKVIKLVNSIIDLQNNNNENNNNDKNKNTLKINELKLLHSLNKWFPEFCLRLPYITNDIINLSNLLCHYDLNESIQLGLNILKKIILLRPNHRENCLNLILSYSGSYLKSLLRTKSIHIIRESFWNHEILNEIIYDLHQQRINECVEFSNNYIKDIESLNNNNNNNNDNNDENNNNKDDNDNNEEDNNTILLNNIKELYSSHLSLSFSLASYNPNLLPDLMIIYNQVDNIFTKLIEFKIIPIIETLILKQGYHSSFVILKELPDEINPLILYIIRAISPQILTKRPHHELVTSIEEFIISRNNDIQFLIPVMGGITKEKFLSTLPNLLKLPISVIKDAFLRLVSPHPPPITPPDLIIELHNFEYTKYKIPLKKMRDVLQLCYDDKELYNQNSFYQALDLLSLQSKLPILFMRTVIITVNKYPNMKMFIINTIFPRLLQGAIWNSKKLWPGFIKCLELFSIHQQENSTSMTSITIFNLILHHIPEDKLQELFKKLKTLKNLLKDHINNMNVGERKNIKQNIIDIINN